MYGRLVNDKNPGVVHLYGEDGELQETIRQVGSSDQYIRTKNGVEVGTSGKGRLRPIQSVRKRRGLDRRSAGAKALVS